jgi:hypothetical protein
MDRDMQSKDYGQRWNWRTSLRRLPHWSRCCCQGHRKLTQRNLIYTSCKYSEFPSLIDEKAVASLIEMLLPRTQKTNAEKPNLHVLQIFRVPISDWREGCRRWSRRLWMVVGLSRKYITLIIIVATMLCRTAPNILLLRQSYFHLFGRSIRPISYVC